VSKEICTGAKPNSSTCCPSPSNAGGSKAGAACSGAGVAPLARTSSSLIRATRSPSISPPSRAMWTRSARASAERSISLTTGGADAVERGLEGVGEADQVVEAEGAGAALDRVDGAEDGVDRLQIAFPTLDGEKALLQLGELLVALLEERLLDGCHRVHEGASL